MYFGAVLHSWPQETKFGRGSAAAHCHKGRESVHPKHKLSPDGVSVSSHKNGPNRWRVPWSALKTECTETPHVPQGFRAQEVHCICLRNLRGQAFHPHPLGAVSILVHLPDTSVMRDAMRIAIWYRYSASLTAGLTPRRQLQSLLCYCDVSCINVPEMAGGIWGQLRLLLFLVLDLLLQTLP